MATTMENSIQFNQLQRKQQARMKLHDEKSKQQVKERWKAWVVPFMVPWCHGLCYVMVRKG